MWTTDFEPAARGTQRDGRALLNTFRAMGELGELYVAVPWCYGRVGRVRFSLFNPRFESVSINLSDRPDRLGYGSHFDDVKAKASYSKNFKNFDL